MDESTSAFTRKLDADFALHFLSGSNSTQSTTTTGRRRAPSDIRTRLSFNEIDTNNDVQDDDHQHRRLSTITSARKRPRRGKLKYLSSKHLLL